MTWGLGGGGFTGGVASGMKKMSGGEVGVGMIADFAVITTASNPAWPRMIRPSVAGRSFF